MEDPVADLCLETRTERDRAPALPSSAIVDGLLSGDFEEQEVCSWNPFEESKSRLHVDGERTGAPRVSGAS